MPTYTRKGKDKYLRKQRRKLKYGTYRRVSGSVAGTGYIKGKRGVQKVMRPKFSNPFKNNSELVQLTYYEDITLNPTARNLGSGGTNKWTWSFNNIYDVNTTGTGHQPMFYDNYAAIYERYKVSFAKMTVTVVNHFVNTTSTFPVGSSTGVVTTQPNYSYKLGIVRDTNDTDQPAQFEQLIEQNSYNTRWRYVAPQLNGSLPKLTMKCAPHKQACLSFDDDTLTSSVGSGPSRNVYANLYIASADGVTDPPSVSLAIKITYYVKFYDRKVNQPEN